MDQQWDVIVIGAGLGGLSAAAHLSKAGQRVLVLEQADGPGGYAHGVQRGPYYFDFSLHSMDGVSPGGWTYAALHDLGVLDKVAFERLRPCYVARLPGREICAAADPIAYEAELIRLFPSEAEGLRGLLDEVMAVYHETRRMQTDGQLGRAGGPEAMLQRYPHLVRAVRESWAQLMDRHIQDPELRGAVSALWTYCGLPPSRLSAVAYALLWGSAHHYGAFYPRGGSMALNRALEDVIRAGGGAVRYQERVARIHVEDGLAAGVSTARGARERCRALVSNASAPSTFGALLDPAHVPPGYAARVASTPDSLSTFNVFLGLERDFAAEGWPPHELLVMDTYDIEAQYRAVRAGDWARVPLLIAHYTGANPACAPAGGAVVTVMTLAPWDYQNVWGTGGDLEGTADNPVYQRLKAEVAEALLARAEAHVPGLRAAVRHQEIATPVTNARCTSNRGGAVFGYEQSVEHMYMGRLDESTPLPNLFLAGAWTVPGGGQSAALISGRDCARRTLALLAQPARPEPARAPAPLSQPHALLGRHAPAFQLRAAGSERDFGLEDCAERPLVLVFASQKTNAAVGALNSAVRARLPLATQATVASVFDFGKVPPLFHGMIRFALGRAYRAAAQGVPADFDPSDYVLILPDWSGRVCQTFGVSGTEQRAVAMVIDRAGTVQGVFQGERLVDDTLQLLRWM